jgi:hypothetical protein
MGDFKELALSAGHHFTVFRTAAEEANLHCELGSNTDASIEAARIDHKAILFGREWIAENISPDPFSINDGPVTQFTVDKFIAKAGQRGLSKQQLEHSFGNIQQFLQGAFDDAEAVWRASQ